jgi:hypothetical protein
MQVQQRQPRRRRRVKKVKRLKPEIWQRLRRAVDERIDRVAQLAFIESMRATYQGIVGDDSGHRYWLDLVLISFHRLTEQHPYDTEAKAIGAYILLTRIGNWMHANVPRRVAS